MNSSVSPPVSRKYSASVRADRAHAKARSGRLAHLAQHDGRPIDDLLARQADLSLLHLQPQVVALARPLADACEDRVAAMLGGHAGDQLLDDDRFAQAGPAEQASLSAADEWNKQVDDFDARLEYLALGHQHVELRRRGVYRPVLLSFHRAAPVDRLAQQVEHPPKYLRANRHGHRPAGVQDVHAAPQAVGRTQRHAPHTPAAEVLLHLAGQVDPVTGQSGVRCRCPEAAVRGTPRRTSNR